MAIRAMVITGGVVHDFDRPRLAILDQLYRRGDVWAQAAPDFSHTERIAEADALLTYTCAITPTDEQCEAIRTMLERGGRWLCLHGTTAVRPESGLPPLAGNRFAGHPPYGHFSVSVTAPNDPLVQGIEPFEVDDELYVIEEQPGLEVLLETRWGGATEQQPDITLPEETRPLMYRYRIGDGEVVYLALGHCQRPFDFQPRVEEVAHLDGPWEQAEFRELLRRGVDWACGG